MIVVTGASGQLGRLVIEALLKKFQPVRSLRRYVKPDSVNDLAERGVQCGRSITVARKRCQRFQKG
jgi:uncharacterized protein YbjT (DUF2867 family)